MGGEGGGRGGGRRAAVAMASCATALSYADRVAISVAAVDMAARFGWSEAEKGAVMASFFYGYIITQLPGGWLSQRFGGGATLFGGVVVWSAFTLLTPAAARASAGLLLLCRGCMGLGEGVGFPSIYHLVSVLVPEAEKARSFGTVQAGVPAGQVVAFLVVPLISARFGWEAVFFLFASIGFLWCAAWVGLGVGGLEHEGRRKEKTEVQDSSEGSRGRELDGLGLLGVVGRRRDGDRGSDCEGGASPVGSSAQLRPLLPATLPNLLRSRAVWVTLVAHVVHNYGWWTLMTWLPTFMHDRFGLDKEGLSLIFLPYTIMFVVFNVVGILADEALRRGVPKLTIRKRATVVGLWGPAALYPLLAASSSVVGALLTVSLIFVCGSCLVCGALLSHTDLAPSNAGIVMALTNSAACVPGLLGVPLTGYILDRTDRDWRAVFAPVSLCSFLGGAAFAWGASAEAQFR